jgi:glucoamylase
MKDGYNIGHPWFISGNGVACFFYKLAALAEKDSQVTSKTKAYFAELYQQNIAGPEDLVALGDRHILTIRRHWYNCHMSEQYDRNSGFMKSVRDLTWSYATYLMAARLRPAVKGG